MVRMTINMTNKKRKKNRRGSGGTRRELLFSRRDYRHRGFSQVNVTFNIINAFNDGE